jgi:hypothetical protein
VILKGAFRKAAARKDYGHAVVDFGNKIARLGNESSCKISPVALSFHSSHKPAKVIGSPSAGVKYQGCLPVAVSCHS